MPTLVCFQDEHLEEEHYFTCKWDITPFDGLKCSRKDWSHKVYEIYSNYCEEITLDAYVDALERPVGLHGAITLGFIENDDPSVNTRLEVLQQALDIITSSSCLPETLHQTTIGTMVYAYFGRTIAQRWLDELMAEEIENWYDFLQQAQPDHYLHRFITNFLKFDDMFVGFIDQQDHNNSSAAIERELRYLIEEEECA